MLSRSGVAVICLVAGLALLNPGAVGSMESPGSAATGAVAPSFVAPKSGPRGDLTLKFAESAVCKRCNDALDKCEKNPPSGNPRICADRYYTCIRGTKCG
jgi:hypothetical protein